MNEIGFNILKRAQNSAKATDQLSNFLSQRGIGLNEVKANPDGYTELIKQYSKMCIDQGLFEESRDRLELEFSRLCEYHSRNEKQLTDQFYNTAKQIILESAE